MPRPRSKLIQPDESRQQLTLQLEQLEELRNSGYVNEEWRMLLGTRFKKRHYERVRPPRVRSREQAVPEATASE